MSYYFLLLIGVAFTERLTAVFIIPVVILYLILLKILKFEMPPGVNLRNLSLLVVPGIIVFLAVGWQFIQAPSRWVGEFFGRVESSPVDILIQFIAGIDYQVIIVGSLGALIFIFGKRQRASLLFFIAAVVPLSITMAASTFQFASTRYAFVSLTSYLILASNAIFSLTSNVTEKSPRLILAGVLFSLFFAVPMDESKTYFTEQHGGRPNFRSAFNLVAENRQPNEWVVTTDPKVEEYYLGADSLSLRQHALETSVEELAKREERVWLVTAGTSRINGEFQSWIKEYCEAVYFDGQETYVYLCEPTNSNIVQNNN